MMKLGFSQDVKEAIGYTFWLEGKRQLREGIWDACVFFTHNYERWIVSPDFLAITAQNEDRLSAHVNI